VPLGLYLSVPFCRTKCSFCNFASGVFSRELHERYIAHMEGEIRGAEALARKMGGRFERSVDSIYLGGGTPSVLDADHLQRLFAAIQNNFDVMRDAEITVECAPGTLSTELIDTLKNCGVNRVSLGVQSFVDQESKSVGRLHTRNIVLTEIARLADSGITDVSVDLIAGLPYQTAESWAYSLDEVLATGVPHVSVYMLEVDEDSRLGRELMAGGTRYHAHHVPDDDLTADLYVAACAVLNANGVQQYEISNFAREGQRSRHNQKYWLRQPYLGFGVDAHSMLPADSDEPNAAVRFATVDDLDQLLAGAARTKTFVDEEHAIEEAWFLGLRLNRGIDLSAMAEEYGIEAIEKYRESIMELEADGLLELDEGFIRLSERGRLLSNTVFEKFIGNAESLNAELRITNVERKAEVLKVLK
jgi:oxygen-independent coproporphyrinogen III oxidase